MLKTISMNCSVFGLDFKMRTKSKEVGEGAGGRVVVQRSELR